MSGTRSALAKKRQTTNNSLPAHVQGMLNQEERLLQRTLDHLNKETKNTIRMIDQEQQVLATKLKLLEQRLEQSRQQSEALLHNSSRNKKMRYERQ